MIMSTVRRHGKSLWNSMVSHVLALVGQAAPAPVGVVAPIVNKSFHAQWMAHFNRTIHSMNKKDY